MRASLILSIMSTVKDAVSSITVRKKDGSYLAFLGQLRQPEPVSQSVFGACDVFGISRRQLARVSEFPFLTYFHCPIAFTLPAQAASKKFNCIGFAVEVAIVNY